MSTNRGVQDWIGEELDTVFGSEQNVDKWQYEKAFPQLKRCLTLMYETLRLYGPMIIIPRYTNTAHPTVKINEKEYTIVCLPQFNGSSLHATVLGIRLPSMATRPLDHSVA